jgi:hypothetical protein
MKNARLTSILGSSLIASALAIGSLASTPFASAQTPRPLADVNIPFTFQTGAQTLPAGKYRVILESNNMVLLQGTGSSAGFVMTHDAIRSHVAAHGTMVFNRYGDKYYLRQIWTAGNPDGLECSKSRAEKQTVQAENMQAPSSVELALNSIPKQ